MLLTFVLVLVDMVFVGVAKYTQSFCPMSIYSSHISSLLLTLCKLSSFRNACTSSQGLPDD
jgi:hypothetical protein